MADNGANLFQRAEIYYGQGNTDQAFAFYEKAIRKILKDEIVNAKMRIPGGQAIPKEMPEELLGHIWQNFTGFIRDPMMNYNPTNSPSAFKLLQSFAIDSSTPHKSFARFRTPDQKIFLKGLQILSSQTLGLIAWDNGDRATASKHYAKVLKEAATRREWDFLGESGAENRALEGKVKHFDLFVAGQVRTTKDNLASLVRNDFNTSSLQEALNEMANGSTSSPNAGLRKDTIPIPITRIEKNGAVTLTENFQLATDGCNGPDCGKRDVKLMRCARCKNIAYCSAECQTKDWKNHKPRCVKKDPSPKAATAN